MLDVTKNYVIAADGSKFECRSCGVSSICLPFSLTAEELSSLDSITKSRRRMRCKDILYHASESLTSIYAVCSGSYKTTILDDEGHEQIIGFFLPGEIIGLDGLCGVTPHAIAIALEASTVCEIPVIEFSRLCDTSPGISHTFMALIRNEITREQRRMMTLGQMGAEARLAEFVLDLGKRFENRGFSATQFNLSMTRHDIANYLGLVPETLSRILATFHNKGYLEIHKRHIKVVDVESLRKLSGTFRHTVVET